MQFGINSTSEWLLIAWGTKPSAIMPFTSACPRKHAKLTVHYNKYVYVWDSQVYGIQVYSILCSLQQVVATYKFTSL